MVLVTAGFASPGRLRDLMRPHSWLRYLLWRGSRSGKPLIVNLAKGENLILRPPPTGDLSVAHEIFVQEIYRSPRPLAPPSVSTILDVGANTGFALVYFASRFPQAQVIAFEPHPEHLVQIERHLQINALAGRVKLIPAAAGVNDRQAFLVDAGECSNITERVGAGRISICVADFFNTIDCIRVDLLKMDCEGGEYDLIMDRRFARLDVRIIVLEWHASATRTRAAEKFARDLNGLVLFWSPDPHRKLAGYNREYCGRIDRELRRSVDVGDQLMSQRLYRRLYRDALSFGARIRGDHGGGLLLRNCARQLREPGRTIHIRCGAGRLIPRRDDQILRARAEVSVAAADTVGNRADRLADDAIVGAGATSVDPARRMAW